jgi:hypothetical protein
MVSCCFTEEHLVFGPIVRRAKIFIHAFKPLPTVSDMDPDDPYAAELLEIYARVLGPNARIVLLELARRLSIGAINHGDLHPRQWKQELREELLDALVYMTIDTLSAEGLLTSKEPPCTTKS